MKHKLRCLMPNGALGSRQREGNENVIVAAEAFSRANGRLRSPQPVSGSQFCFWQHRLAFGLAWETTKNGRGG